MDVPHIFAYYIRFLCISAPFSNICKWIRNLLVTYFRPLMYLLLPVISWLSLRFDSRRRHFSKWTETARRAIWPPEHFYKKPGGKRLVGKKFLWILDCLYYAWKIALCILPRLKGAGMKWNEVLRTFVNSLCILYASGGKNGPL